MYSLESPLNKIIQLLCRRSIYFTELAIFASRPSAMIMINLHWLELPMARTIFHGPKIVRAIYVRLYFNHKAVMFVKTAAKPNLVLLFNM